MQIDSRILLQKEEVPEKVPLFDLDIGKGIESIQIYCLPYPNENIYCLLICRKKSNTAAASTTAAYPSTHQI